MDLSELLKKHTETNLEIAKYLGWERDPNNENRVLGVVNGKPTWRSIKSMNYYSWNELMEVIQKIEDTQYDFGTDGSYYIDFCIMADAIIVYNSDKQFEPLVLMNKSEGMGSLETEPTMFDDKFATLFKAVVIVVKWLNNIK